MPVTIALLSELVVDAPMTCRPSLFGPFCLAELEMIIARI